jgi:hypothetical protein
MTAPETFPLTPDGVTAALRTLDVESWEIADRLKALGIKGVIGNECACALAAYIRKLIPQAGTVIVEAESIRIDGYLRDEWGFDEPIFLPGALPDGAIDFVQEFDKGEYPDLIEETPDGA